MNPRQQQRVLLWAGPLMVAIFSLGLWPIAGFVPPSSPNISLPDLVAFYQSNVTNIRLGMLMVIGCAGLMVPVFAVIAVQMLRIKNATPALAYTQLAAGSVSVIFFIVPELIWSTAAFRPDRNPELLQLLHDLGWIMFIMPFSLAAVQNMALAFAILLDDRPHPVFPRWAAYLNLWVALLFVPGGIATFFRTGPFAWNGLFPFWIPLVVFGNWFAVILWLLFKAVNRQELEEGPAAR